MELLRKRRQAEYGGALEDRKMRNGITVLSLFDGISCGHIALDRSGIPIKAYFASEIKDIAIKCTMEHYPDTIQIGDVTKVSYADGVLHTEKGNFEVGEIDLLIGGSTCQDFSSLKFLTILNIKIQMIVRPLAAFQ